MGRRTVEKQYWRYDSLPNLQFDMEGGLILGPYVDVEDDTKRSHFEQEFNWRIDQDTEEFVFRIARAVRIEGGLSQQPDGSVVFDGGVGSGDGSGVSTFGLSFKISHEESGTSEVDEAEEDLPEEEPEGKEVAFFDHSQHKLLLAPENFYKDVSGASCDACMEPIQRAKWEYRCPNAACDYAVHAACAQFPRMIRHPSHRKHTVKLLKLSPSTTKECDACKGYILHGLHYHCSMCDFDAHPVCPEWEDYCDSPQESFLEPPVGEDCYPSQQVSTEYFPEVKEDYCWDPSQHLNMPPQQYFAHQTQVLEAETRLNALFLDHTRQTAALAAEASRDMLSLTRDW